MVHKVSINFKSSNICSDPQSFKVYHGGRECSLWAKNPASSQDHSLPSLALKHWRRASFPAKTWSSFMKQDVNALLWLRLAEKTWECSNLKKVLPNVFISKRLFQCLPLFLFLILIFNCFLLLMFLLFFFLVDFFFLPPWIFAQLSVEVCILYLFRAACWWHICVLSIKNDPIFSKQYCSFLSYVNFPPKI